MSDGIEIDTGIDDDANLAPEQLSPEDVQPFSLSSTVREILNRDAKIAPEGGDKPHSSELFNLEFDDHRDETDASAPPVEDSDDDNPATDSGGSTSHDPPS